MSSFNESVGLGYLKTNAIEFVKYPFAWLELIMNTTINHTVFGLFLEKLTAF